MRDSARRTPRRPPAPAGAGPSLSTRLAQAGISIFAVSTFDTDYILMKAEKLAPAIEALEAGGHTVERAAL